MCHEIRVINAFELPPAPTPEGWALPPDYFEKLDHAAREHAEAVEQAVVLKLTKAFDPFNQGNLQHSARLTAFNNSRRS